MDTDPNFNPAYANKTLKVKDLIAKMKSGASQPARIPSIQRPFVWEPHQVARLIDSLLHGWPCGNLLFWEPGEKTKEIFPSRPFQGDYSTRAKDQRNSKDKLPESFVMVLDGQQRMQSLLIALTGSYEATEKEWKSDNGESGGKPDPVRKELCFNLAAWSPELAGQSFHYLDSESGGCLVWKSEGERSDGIVPLSVLYADHTASRSDTPALRWLKKQIGKLAVLEVPVLWVSSENWERDTAEGQEAEIADSVTTMFTRLNTAGTPLTKEQLLAAEIKQAWEAFPESIEDFRGVLRDKYSMDIPDDELVRGFNITLKAHTRTKDIKRAYRRLSTQAAWQKVWGDFTDAMSATLNSLENKTIRYRTEYKSMYTIWFATALVYLQKQLDDTDLSEDQDFPHVLAKWIFVTSWAKIWANRSGQFVNKYTAALVDYKGGEHSAAERMKEWLRDDNLRKAAKDNVETAQASARGSVRDYYTLLMVWMRLQAERSEVLTLFEMKGDAKSWAVDHLIPAAWVKNEAHTAIYNSIGNCWLLETDANSKKSDEPMADFWEHSVRRSQDELRDLAANISMDYRILALDRDADLGNDRYTQEIQEREKRIKQELCGYIDGEDFTLNYKIFGNPLKVYYDISGIFRGSDYLCFAPQRSVSSYLSCVRKVYKLVGLDEDGIAKIVDETPKEDLQEVLLSYLDKIRENNADSLRSYWRSYVKFLTGGKLMAGRRKGGRKQTKEAASPSAEAPLDLNEPLTFLGYLQIKGNKTAAAYDRMVTLILEAEELPPVPELPMSQINGLVKQYDKGGTRYSKDQVEPGMPYGDQSQRTGINSLKQYRDFRMLYDFTSHLTNTHHMSLKVANEHAVEIIRALADCQKGTLLYDSGAMIAARSLVNESAAPALELYAEFADKHCKAH